MKYASKDKKALSDIAIIDNDFIQRIVAGIPEGSGTYTHHSTHPATMITEDTNHNFVTTTEKNNFHASGSDNQDLSGLVEKVIGKGLSTNDLTDTLKSNYDAAYDHSITTHSGSDPFLAKLVLTADKPTAANTTPVTLGLSFDYEANSKYIIDIYAIVAPGAATTGCGFMLDVSSAVTYVGLFVSHQLANTGTVSGSGSRGDSGSEAQGVSSGMPNTGSNFVYGGGSLITGANTGTATFFFRSETTAVTTCKANTIIRIMKV